MKMENQTCRIKPADRLASVSEYYFSKKLKEVAQMNAEGKDVISLGIGSPDMPPSEKTIQTLCEAACNPDGHGYMPYVGIPELRQAFCPVVREVVRRSIESQHRDTTAYRFQRRHPARDACFCQFPRRNKCWCPIRGIPPTPH